MDLATIQDWTKGRRELVTTPDHLDAITALATSLNGSEPPGAVAAMIKKAYGSHVEQGKVQVFWGMFCDAVRTFGPAQSRLVDLLYEMSNQSDVVASDGSSAKDSDSMICWHQVCSRALRTRIPGTRLELAWPGRLLCRGWNREFSW